MRSVIITGVSRGIGEALFRRLHEAGDRILALGRHFSESQVALANAQVDRVRLREADLAVPASLPGTGELASFVEDADELVLIHNAAAAFPHGPPTRSSAVCRPQRHQAGRRVVLRVAGRPARRRPERAGGQRRPRCRRYRDAGAGACAAASEAYFPMSDFFVGLHRSGQLSAADDVAAQIIAAHLA